MYFSYFLSSLSVINFDISLSFLVKSFFDMTRKSRQKCKYLKERKEVLTRNKKHFSSFLREFQLSDTVLDLRVRLSD